MDKMDGLRPTADRVPPIPHFPSNPSSPSTERCSENVQSAYTLRTGEDAAVSIWLVPGAVSCQVSVGRSGPVPAR